jgi:hypothetical protein
MLRYVGWLFLLIATSPRVFGDTVYDGATRRYGCIRQIDSSGLLLEVKCDKADTVRVEESNLSHFEFNQQIEGFAAAGLMRSRCAPCSCSDPKEYKLVEFAKGAGVVFTLEVALRGGRLRFRNATDGAWYGGPVEKIFSVTRFYQCPREIGKNEIPPSFEREDGR